MINQPQATAAYNRGEVPTLERIESDFLRMSVTYAEDEMPIFDRWFRILEYLPHVRGRHLFEDLTEAYKDIYTNGSGSMIAACIDFLLLRQQFFMLLSDNGIGRTHQNNYEIEISTFWFSKMYDRSVDVPVPKSTKGKYKPVETKPTTTHLWLQ